jgi:hypothetical protein
MDDRSRLEQWIAREAGQPVHPAAMAIADLLRARHGAATAAILFYGSCLRQAVAASEPPEGVLDFYVLVDAYRAAYPGRLMALANALLPPNVFHLQAPYQGQIVRAKYAVISLAQFRRGTSGDSFHSSIWARFAQPSRLIWVRDSQVQTSVVAALADAVITMAAQIVPLMPEGFAPGQLWLRGFQETYRAELRTESAARAEEIYAKDRARYDAIMPWAVSVAGLPAGGAAADLVRRRAQLGWIMRRVLGKVLSVLRLIKGLFTFDGGVDYILWKIERHTGVRLPVSPWQRRHPLLASPVFLWRLYRLGAIR